MKTRQDLRWQVTRVFAHFAADMEEMFETDEWEKKGYVYDESVDKVTILCEEYFNFERESTTSPIGDTGRFAKMFDEKTNNKLCYGLYALIAVMVVAWIINFILI